MPISAFNDKRKADKEKSPFELVQCGNISLLKLSPLQGLAFFGNNQDSTCKPTHIDQIIAGKIAQIDFSNDFVLNLNQLDQELDQNHRHTG